MTFRTININKQMKILMLIFLLAIVARVIGSFIRETIYFHKPFIVNEAGIQKKLICDDIWYHYTAKSLMEGKGYAYNNIEIEKTLGFKFTPPPKNSTMFVQNNENYIEHKMIPPIYPLFLAICYSLFGCNTLAYFVPQILLGAITSILIYFIAEDIFNEKVAALSGLMVAVYPDLVLWTYQIRVETLFVFFLTLLFWLLLRRAINRNIYYAFAIGLMIGIASLTRLTLFFFIPIVVVWLWKYWQGSINKMLLWLIVLFLSLGMILLPWAIHNMIVFNSFTVLTDEGGAIFYDYHDFPVNLIAMSNSSSLPYFSTFISFVIHNPKEFILKSSNRFIKYLSPFTMPMKTEAKIYKTMTWLIIFPVSLWGMFFAIKKHWRASGLLIAFIAYYVLFHGFTVVDDGLVYRYPMLPFLCIFAAYGYYIIFSRYYKRINNWNVQ